MAAAYECVVHNDAMIMQTTALHNFMLYHHAQPKEEDVPAAERVESPMPDLD